MHRYSDGYSISLFQIYSIINGRLRTFVNELCMIRPTRYLCESNLLYFKAVNSALFKNLSCRFADPKFLFIKFNLFFWWDFIFWKKLLSFSMKWVKFVLLASNYTNLVSIWLPVVSNNAISVRIVQPNFYR